MVYKKSSNDSSYQEDLKRYFNGMDLHHPNCYLHCAIFEGAELQAAVMWGLSVPE